MEAGRLTRPSATSRRPNTAREKVGRLGRREEDDLSQWDYEAAQETLVCRVLKPGRHRTRLVKALTAANEADVASGGALNHILSSIIAAEQKGAKGFPRSSPQLLDSVRYSGGPADALNLVRQSGRLQFPAAFDAPELRDLRDQLDKDFAAVATPILAGKPLDSAKLMKLELTLSKLETASAPVVRNLSFEDAIAARKFLNQFANALRSMKAGVTGLVNPAWAMEGTNVADLVKLMTNKAPVRSGPTWQRRRVHGTSQSVRDLSVRPDPAQK